MAGLCLALAVGAILSGLALAVGAILSGLALTVRVVLSGLALAVRVILSTFPLPERFWVTELGLLLFPSADDRLLADTFICLGGLTEEDLVMLPVLDLGLLTRWI